MSVKLTFRVIQTGKIINSNSFEVTNDQIEEIKQCKRDGMVETINGAACLIHSIKVTR